MAASSLNPSTMEEELTTTLNKSPIISDKSKTTLNSNEANGDEKNDAKGTVDASKEPEVQATPEQQKRLAILLAKRDKLFRTQAQLTKQKHVALLRLAAVLPTSTTDYMDLPSASPEYLPSTLAHTIEPSLPHLDDEDQTALMGEANKIIKEHIRMLHEYNEIKDVAQGLIGMIADQRGKRVVDVEGEFGVGKGD